MLDGGNQIAQSCANRMDPTTSRISASEIEKIEIVKGPYSVRFGQSFGSIINIITKRPKMSENFKLNGSIEGGYEFNGEGKNSGISLSGGNQKIDFLLNGNYRNFGNYKSGDDTEIAASFEAYDYSAKLGVNFTAAQRLQLSWRQSFANNVLHAGLPMDAKEDRGDILALDYAFKPKSNLVKSIQTKFYGSWVDHLMTNEFKTSSKFSLALTDVYSTTYGSKIEIVTMPTDNLMLYSGIDYKYLNKDGKRVRTLYINPCTMAHMSGEATDLIWQNSESENFGIYTELQYFMNDKFSLTSDLRSDYVTINIKEAATDFSTFYGEKLQPEDKIHFNFFAKVHYQISSKNQVELAIGKGTRTPDLLELFINHFNVGKDSYEYLGNPELLSEKNIQTDLVFYHNSENFSFNATIFYSIINDYITAFVNEKINRKYTPCALPKYTKQFTNVDKVYQYGFELGVDWKIIENLKLSSFLNYTYAQNETWNEPVAEIAPLDWQSKLSFREKNFLVEINSRYVAKQDRISESFGETETESFKVFGIGLQYRIKTLATLNFNVDNILNENYYEHLSRAYLNITEKIPYFETGRNIKIGVKVNF